MSEDTRSDWFVLEGRIDHFQWAEGRENLLEQIQQRSRLKNAAAGAAAAALNMYGTLATSAMVAMYDGEYTENFACTVADKVVCGSFCGARKLRDGDQVRMVVRPLENGVLYAFAVQRPSDELLWLPSQVFCGDKYALKKAIQLARNLSIVAWIVVSLIFTIVNLTGESIGISSLLGMIAVFAISSPAVIFFGIFFPHRAGKEFGEIGSKVFSLLGFPDPGNLNMIRADYERQTDEPHTNNIYMYRLVLDSLANGTKITTKLERDISLAGPASDRKDQERENTARPKKRKSRR